MIKSSAILLAGLLVTWILRRRGAAERHIVWAAAIISAALLPVLSFLLPAWQPGLAQRVAGALPSMPSILGPRSNPNISRATDVVFRADSIEPAVAALARIWWIVWAGGLATGLFVLAIGFIRQRSLASRTQMLSDPTLAAIARDAAARLGCRRRIRITQSLDECMPMTWGVLRPRVLVPKCIDQWPEERKRIVIAHELAHVRRLDWLLQMLAQLACAVYWFNPLFWIACNGLFRESEEACDDMVINLGVDAREYASHLFEIARALRHSGSVWSPTLAMARPSTLEKRFAALLNSTSNHRGITGRAVLLATAATILIVVPLAALDTLPAGLARSGSASPTVIQYTTPPLYSDAARARGVEGFVTVEARIGTDGTVKRLHVVKRLGYGLDENALLAVRDWRFLPAMRDGMAVEAITQIDVEFSLRNAELNELIANDMATRLGPGVLPPQVVHRVEPQYSPQANRQMRAGGVILDAVIPEDGSPRIVRVIQSMDWELDENAINALKQWRFSPAMKDGRPVKVRMNIAINFPSRVS
jgi:TonB family protein